LKLLFDQNLSHRLVSALHDVFPEAEHVRNVGLKAAADTLVWNYAKSNGFMIVSKDADFHQRSLVHGHPPKVIWIRLGNCSTARIVRLLRDHVDTIRTFENDPEAAFLSLS
jgi:predicted nuclease of predicted toxin-antitoxin system